MERNSEDGNSIESDWSVSISKSEGGVHTFPIINFILRFLNLVSREERYCRVYEEARL